MYNILMYCYQAGIQIAAWFKPKARLWVEGRRDWRTVYPAKFIKKSKVLWLHAASLGEFEQGRPLIEAFRQQQPDWQLVLTFFSPSGYVLRHNYPHVDAVLYLPLDTRRNAEDFIGWLQPDLVVFVKYEFWHHYLHTLKRKAVPVWLIAAVFRPGQPFFQWYGAFWRSMLGCFTHIFVQNEASAQLLKSLYMANIHVAGDTRIDRVAQLAASAPANPVVAHFTAKATGPVWIVGSAWPEDEAIFLPLFQEEQFSHYLLVIAPHEPAPGQLEQLRTRLPNRKVVAYSEALTQTETPEDASVLLIDNVGMLNALYQYGTVAYIGGGFGKGIHNTLEPAAYGLPVVFGPNYRKFAEAHALIERGGGFSIGNTTALREIIGYLEQPQQYEQASKAARSYIAENKGATQRIMAFARFV
jgi:3-deoxy-D-manno-octulosonic-acid transferase